MNVAKLNPVGYKSTTDKGNTYKKSNLGATAGLAAMALVDSVPYISKSPKAQLFGQLCSMGEALPALFKVAPKFVKPLKAVGIALDLAFGIIIGRSIDKSINKKRAAKADAQAEAIQAMAEAAKDEQASDVE